MTSEEAEEANRRRGEMRVFDESDDIFDNMAQAEQWIDMQMEEEGGAVDEKEADSRLQRAREKLNSN